MDKIALGFSNTVDYEIEWNPEYLERLICLTGLSKKDIRKKRQIADLKDLLASILFHMQEGSGCGLLTEHPEIIEAFIEGCNYKITLGGTNMRAAEAISALGGKALVHLVSINEDTLTYMPQNISWAGGEAFHCRFPHIAIQFPKKARVKANDIEIVSPRENRVIYSGDMACAQMPLCPEFFTRAAGSEILLLSSFDLISDAQVLSQRLSEVKAAIDGYGSKKPLIFYEHACFGNASFEKLVQKELTPCIDLYSMNEDEFQTLADQKIDLLDAESVLPCLYSIHSMFPHTCIMIHTSQWGLVSGEKAEDFADSLKYAMLTASAKYLSGKVSKEAIGQVENLPVRQKAQEFSKKIMSLSRYPLRCFPSAEILIRNPTTIGLGDSFVGGFLYNFYYNHTT